jgi:hypothetical protein
MPDDLIVSLRTAIDGLEYPSESDSPFEIFRWDPSKGTFSAQALAALRKKEKKPRIQEVAVDDFFAALADSEDAARFKNLQTILTKNLSDLKVFRIGSIQVDIYIVGRNTEGLWLGLHTTSIET